VVPTIQGGVTSGAILLIIAIVGTTVAPWQLFFQQSNVVDKRITPRFINHERADTFLGSVVVVVGAGALMIAGAYAARGTALAGHFTDALAVARALGHKDAVLGTLFAIVLLDASIIGASAVTLSTSYAIGDFFGLKHSLHRSFRDAPGFYTIFAGLVVLAAGIVLIPGAPLGVVTEAVQALAGLLLLSASVFLLLLCNDREVLGPWVNQAWLNVAATVIIATLLMLSGTLMATTMFPRLNAARIAVWLSVALVAGLAAAGIALRIGRKRRRFMQRRSLFPRLMRPMLVVVPRVLGQDPPEVSFAVDQQVVKALAPQCCHIPLRKGICPGRPDRRLDDPRAMAGEHVVERRRAAGPARYAQVAASGWSAASVASIKGPGWPRLTCAGGPARGSCPRCP